MINYKLKIFYFKQGGTVEIQKLIHDVKCEGEHIISVFLRCSYFLGSYEK